MGDRRKDSYRGIAGEEGVEMVRQGDGLVGLLSQILGPKDTKGFEEK